MRPVLTTQLDYPHLFLPLTLPPYLYTLPSRSNPVLMIRTFAYQLAEAVPALRPHLMPPKLTTEEVVVLADAETAFHRLLLQPLNEVCEVGALLGRTGLPFFPHCPLSSPPYTPHRCSISPTSASCSQ